MEQETKIDMNHVKSLKKSLPEILHTFQDMVNRVEMTKNLLENRKSDMEIRKESCRTQAVSYYKKFELAFNDLYDILDNHKSQFLKQFEDKTESVLENLQNDSKTQDKLGYYNNVIESVSDLKKN